MAETTEQLNSRLSVLECEVEEESVQMIPHMQAYQPDVVWQEKCLQYEQQSIEDRVKLGDLMCALEEAEHCNTNLSKDLKASQDYLTVFKVIHPTFCLLFQNVTLIGS